MEVHNQWEDDRTKIPLPPRTHPRFQLDIEIKIYSRTVGLLAGRTLDISESGISALLKVEVPLNEIVQLEFTLTNEFISVRGLVRQRNCFRYGFQFVDPDPGNGLIRQACREYSIEPFHR